MVCVCRVAEVWGFEIDGSGGKKALLLDNGGIMFVVTPAVKLLKTSEFLGTLIVKSLLLSDEKILL